jgi:hypothetical protein
MSEVEAAGGAQVEAEPQAVAVKPAGGGGRAAPTRLPVVLAVWTVALAIGFWLVVALGGPVVTSTDELDAAFHPATPVSEAAARTSADTIVRISYPDFHGVEPQVVHATDFDIERYVLVYSRPEVLSGVRVSVEVVSGDVQVTTFP